MRPLHVLFANEPRSFREVFAAVIRELRPDTEVTEALPENIDAEVERLEPDLVFCSGITPLVERSVPAWVDLYPHEPVAMIYSAGELSTVTDLDLATMLSVVDRTRELLGEPERPPTGPGDGAHPERAARRRKGGPGAEGGTDVPAKYDPSAQCGYEPGVEHWNF